MFFHYTIFFQFDNFNTCGTILTVGRIAQSGIEQWTFNP